ncbi:MAG: DUF1800 domain-containing protein [Fimbriimonadaceae bacterium]|nr:DUF1800 domain-containing protein [Fimbriimonadaceae bacterium]
MFEVAQAENVRHLLRRFGLGASATEVEFYGKEGYSRAVELLISTASTDEAFDCALEKFANDQGIIAARSLQARWLTAMIATRRPLVHAMALFWHDHFATSATKVDKPMMMHGQVEILQRQALGSFPDLLRAVSKDPAMLYWLDNHENRKGKPNENFAREVMELFTLGIGHYSEKDVQEAARAFTGWTFRSRGNGRNINQTNLTAFVDRATDHDDGSKTILGSTAPFTGDEVLDLLCRQARTAYYITEKVWGWFAYPEPDPKLVERIAGEWQKKGMVIADLVRLVATAPEFTSDKAKRAIVKNPVQFCVAPMRQLGMGQLAIESLAAEGDLRRRAALGGLASVSTKAMGMELLYPPDVSGWEGGPGWISSATMVERIKWADKLFGGRQNPRASQAMMMLYAGNTEPEAFAKRTMEILDAELPATKVTSLVEGVKASAPRGVTAGNIRPAAHEVTKLLFGAPEFQFC